MPTAVHAAPRAAPPALGRDGVALATVFVVSGVVHLVRPEVYAPLMPRAVPAHRAVILGSGVLELVCAAGLAHPRTRSAAGRASLAVLVGVYPANLKLTRDAFRGRNRALQAASVARLPLQWPMIRTAWRLAGR